MEKADKKFVQSGALSSGGKLLDGKIISCHGLFEL